MTKTLLAVAALVAAAAMFLPATGAALSAQRGASYTVAFGFQPVNHFGNGGVNYGRPRI